MTALAHEPHRASRAALQTLQIGMGWFSEDPGGLNRVYANLVAELLHAGVEVQGFVVGTADVMHASGGSVSAFAPAGSSLVFRMHALRRAALDWLRTRPDAVVVSHFAQNVFPMLDQLGEHPFVVHFQGPWGQESRVEGAPPWAVMAKELVERAVYGRASQAIVLSSAFREILATQFGVDRERIHVIPGGVEVDRFSSAPPRAACRAALGWPSDRPIVLCVRRLVRRVGVDVLVESAVALRERVPDALVLMAGTGPLRAELEERIAALGLQDTVKLLGFVPDDMLPLAYRAADLTVVPTTALEGFGLITVESLAAGTPCVVTPVGGLGEIVAPLAPQLVTAGATKGDIGATLADALLGAVPLPSTEQCSAYARRCFDWPVIAARVRDVYELARQ
ncbi:MAG TPA: glycosyltransferase family 4 protein [Gemmatimonadaceae bacterium]|jgi:glycosyltransferase involved in cell wall biosynthesis|nr:glycosyltransferase family 4 protein [Gemmatimonadaceae bacterium]